MNLLPTYWYAVTFAAGFLVGAAFGWYSSLDHVDISERGFRRIIAIVITTMWVQAVFADILVSAYNVPILVHAIMGAVAGYLFSDDGLDIQIGGQ